MLKLLLSRFEF